MTGRVLGAVRVGEDDLRDLQLTVPATRSGLLLGT